MELLFFYFINAIVKFSFVLIFSLVLVQWPYIFLLYVNIWKFKYKSKTKNNKITISDQLIKFVKKY